MCNIQFVCHANKQKSLCYFFSVNVSWNIALPFTARLSLKSLVGLFFWSTFQMLFLDLKKEFLLFSIQSCAECMMPGFWKSPSSVDADFLQSLPFVNDLIAAISIIWFYPWMKVHSLTDELNRKLVQRSVTGLPDISGPPFQRNKLTWDLCIWPQSWSLTCVSLSDSEIRCTLWRKPLGLENLLQSKADWIVYFFDLSLETCNYRADFRTFCFNQYWLITFLSQSLQALSNWWPAKIEYSLVIEK